MKDKYALLGAILTPQKDTFPEVSSSAADLREKKYRANEREKRLLKISQTLMGTRFAVAEAIALKCNKIQNFEKFDFCKNRKYWENKEKKIKKFNRKIFLSGWIQRDFRGDQQKICRGLTSYHIIKCIVSISMKKLSKNLENLKKKALAWQIDVCYTLVS